MRSKGPRWLATSGTEIGRRKENDDRVAAVRLKHLKKTYYAVVVCDGVGSRSGSGDCAGATAARATEAIKGYLHERGSNRSLSIGEANTFAEYVAGAVDGIEGQEQQSTTLALALFSEKSGLVAWAGDSRIYVLTRDGELSQITDDHHDREGAILRYVTGRGRVKGGLDSRYLNMSNVVAVFGTTDGVHEYCSPDEMRSFVLYCLANHIGSEALGRQLAAFLEDNLADNASMSLVYRRMKFSKVCKIAGLSTPPR